MRYAGVLLFLFTSMPVMAAALRPQYAEGIDTGSPTSPPAEDAESRADAPLFLPVAKCEIRLNFSKSNADSIFLSAVVFTTPGTVVAGQSVSVDIGGVTQTFTLDKRGRAKAGNATFAVETRAGSGTAAVPNARISLRIKKGSFAASFADENLTAAASVRNVIRTVPLTVIFAGTTHQNNRTLLYTAKAGKSGFAQFDPILDE